jgi:hypothetical protein
MDLHEYEDLWSEIWEQLPEDLQCEAEQGVLRMEIHCDDVVACPRTLILSKPRTGRSWTFVLPPDGRLTENDINLIYGAVY